MPGFKQACHIYADTLPRRSWNDLLFAPHQPMANASRLRKACMSVLSGETAPSDDEILEFTQLFHVWSEEEHDGHMYTGMQDHHSVGHGCQWAPKGD